MKIFYLVWCREIGYAHYEHDSLKSAESEAERLARKHPGRKFFVLEAKSAVVKNDVVWEKNNDGIPY